MILAGASPALARDSGVPGVPAEAEAVFAIGVCVVAVAVLAVLWRRRVIGPGSLARGAGAKRDVSTVPPVIWLVAACVMFLIPTIGAMLIHSLPSSAVGEPDSIKRDALTMLAGYAVAIGAAIPLLNLFAARAPGAGLRFRWRDVFHGAGAFLIILPIVLAVGLASRVVTTWITDTPPDAIAHSTLTQILDNRSNPWIVAIIGAAVIGAPVHEEIAFRIFLQSAMIGLVFNRWVAILITGVLFALVHRGGAEPVPWHALAPIFVLGIACGVAYERTARPGVPIMIHLLFNAWNVALLFILE